MIKNIDATYDEQKGTVTLPIDQFQDLINKLKICEQNKQNCKKLNHLLNQQISDYNNLTKNS